MTDIGCTFATRKKDSPIITTTTTTINNNNSYYFFLNYYHEKVKLSLLTCLSSPSCDKINFFFSVPSFFVVTVPGAPHYTCFLVCACHLQVYVLLRRGNLQFFFESPAITTKPGVTQAFSKYLMNK